MRLSKYAWFLDCYKPHGKMVLFVVLGSLACAALDIFFPMAIRYLMDELLPNGFSPLMLKIAAGILLLYAFSCFMNYQVESKGRTMGARIEYALRQKLFSHVMRLGYAYHDSTRSGQLLSRIVNDISEVGNLMFAIPHLAVVCSVTIIGSIALLFYLNWQLALVVAFLLLAKTYESLQLNRRMKQMFMQTRVSTGDMNGQLSESLQGIRLVKAFHAEEQEMEKLELSGGALLQAESDAFRVVGKMHSGMDFFSNATNLVVTVVGAIFISLGWMTVSDLVAFLLYIMACMRPVFQVMMLTEVYQKGMAGFERYRELMEVAEPSEESRKEPLASPRGEIRFDHVGFSYEGGTPVFRDFNLCIQPKERIGIVGTTGGGKTTLCELIMGFYELDEGSISIDGTDIRRIRMDDLRKSVGIIQQEIFLFSASVRENIAYGKPDATEEEILKAAELSEAHSFIKELPQGYDTFIGERGVKLSGGQRQRIAIARMFLRNPRILVLDEATSALDNETERQIQKAMQMLSRDRTTITVAHRLATVRNADRILVLEHGVIVEEGSHEELMKRKGIYYGLCNRK